MTCDSYGAAYGKRAVVPFLPGRLRYVTACSHVRATASGRRPAFFAGRPIESLED